MTSTRRRTAGVTQTAYPQYPHPSEIAEPAHPFLPNTGYEQGSVWATPNANFVHTDPLVDNSNDTMMAPPPANLSLTVPGTGSYNANTLLYSPSSDYSAQSQVHDQYILPSYDGSHLDGGNDNTNWQAKIDPAIYDSKMTTKSRYNPHPDTEVKTKDLSPPCQSLNTNNMSPKERTAHRKAIEEKSSMKRKLAEQRLSRAITSRLGGTFVPGLANQMNQAAEIIERDAETIQVLEAELKRLRNNYGDVQMKFRN